MGLDMFLTIEKLQTLSKEIKKLDVDPMIYKEDGKKEKEQ